jgi:hypothetical protein
MRLDRDGWLELEVGDFGSEKDLPRDCDLWAFAPGHRIAVGVAGASGYLWIDETRPLVLPSGPLLDWRLDGIEPGGRLPSLRLHAGALLHEHEHDAKLFRAGALLAVPVAPDGRLALPAPDERGELGDLYLLEHGRAVPLFLQSDVEAPLRRTLDLRRIREFVVRVTDAQDRPVPGGLVRVLPARTPVRKSARGEDDTPPRASGLPVALDRDGAARIRCYPQALRLVSAHPEHGEGETTVDVGEARQSSATDPFPGE